MAHGSADTLAAGPLDSGPLAAGPLAEEFSFPRSAQWRSAALLSSAVALLSSQAAATDTTATLEGDGLWGGGAQGSSSDGHRRRLKGGGPSGGGAGGDESGGRHHQADYDSEQSCNPAHNAARVGATRRRSLKGGGAKTGGEGGGGIPDDTSLCPAGSTCSYFDANINYNLQSFDDIGRAFLLILQCTTFDTWTDAMYALMDSFSPFVFIYFVLIALLGGIFVVQVLHPPTSRFHLHLASTYYISTCTYYIST